MKRDCMFKQCSIFNIKAIEVGHMREYEKFILMTCLCCQDARCVYFCRSPSRTDKIG